MAHATAAVGLSAGAATSRVLRNQIFGAQPFDASTYAIACTLLLIARRFPGGLHRRPRGVSVPNPVSALSAN